MRHQSFRRSALHLPPKGEVFATVRASAGQRRFFATPDPEDRADRKAAAAEKDKAVTAAGPPIIRWNLKPMPNDCAIRAAIPVSTPRRAVARGETR